MAKVDTDTDPLQDVPEAEIARKLQEVAKVSLQEIKLLAKCVYALDHILYPLLPPIMRMDGLEERILSMLVDGKLDDVIDLAIRSLVSRAFLHVIEDASGSHYVVAATVQQVSGSPACPDVEIELEPDEVPVGESVLKGEAIHLLFPPTVTCRCLPIWKNDDVCTKCEGKRVKRSLFSGRGLERGLAEVVKQLIKVSAESTSAKRV